MDRNVVQLHERIRFHLDELDSPRYHADIIDEGINTAIGSLIDRIVDKGAQRTQKERDMLYPIEVKDYPVFRKLGEDLLPIVFLPEDYRNLLGMKLSVAASITVYEWTGTIDAGTTKSKIIVDAEPTVEIAVGDYLKVLDQQTPQVYVYVKIASITNTVVENDTFHLERSLSDIPTGVVTAYALGAMTDYNAEPIDYDEINVIEKDPYKSPDISAVPPRVFYTESSDGIHLFYGEVGTLIVIDGRICYVKNPAVVNRGIEHVIGDGDFSSDQTVIAVEVTVYDDEEGGGPVTYDIGDEISALSATNITSGKVVKSYTNSDLPNTLFDNIAVGAAMVISERSGDEVRLKILQKYNNFGYADKLGHNQ